MWVALGDRYGKARGRSQISGRECVNEGGQVGEGISMQADPFGGWFRYLGHISCEGLT